MFALRECLFKTLLNNGHKFKPTFYGQLVANTSLPAVSVTAVRLMQHERQYQRRRPDGHRPDVFSSINTRELEQQLSLLKADGVATGDVLRKLLFTYCRRSELWPQIADTNNRIGVRVQELLAEIDSNQYPMSDPMYASLIEFYTNTQDLESALQAMSKISRSFRLDAYKVFNLATLLARNGRTDDAIQMVSDYLKQSFSSGNIGGRRAVAGSGGNDHIERFTSKSINRLLNTLIDKRLDPSVIKRVFEMCIESSAVQVNKTVAGPLIRQHMVNKDMSKALDEFIHCANNYRVIPWGMELMRAFIQLDDKHRLETVVQKMVEIYGRNNTLLDLSAAYIYQGMAAEANRHLKTAGRLTQQSVEFVCSKFVTDQKMTELRQFIDITASVPDLNREKLYQILVASYKQLGDIKRAQGVLDLMRQQNIEPTVYTLNLLRN